MKCFVRILEFGCYPFWEIVLDVLV